MVFTGFAMSNNTRTMASPGSADLEPVTLPGVAPAEAIGLMPTLAAGVSPIEPPALAESALRQRLLSRVAHSAAANRGFETVRLGDGVWRELAPGVRAHTQHADGGSQTTLVELAPGAVWLVQNAQDLHAGAAAGAGVGADAAHECLVLRGDVLIDADMPGAFALRAHDYQFIGTDAPWLRRALLRAPQGALLYWRTSVIGASEFGDIANSHGVPAGDAGWEPLRHGVQIKPLQKVGERISMLVRFEPGARVPEHPHGLGEECLMVQGELFLGDVLLREGEFQFAPAGSGHGELFSDVGCVLFFSGAIDPSAVDPAVRVGY